MIGDNPTDRTSPVPGEVVLATEVITSSLDPRRTRNIILLLAACVALMQTGFGIIFPVFARRFGEFGSGVEELGLMTTSFALAQLVAAPVLGSLADRLGRRPIVLLALAAFAVTNIGLLLARSTAGFIVVRAAEGALTAGLFPAAMGIVADIVPEHRRAQWIGVVMGSYGAGFVLGPILGGVLYDGWGFEAPFVASATLAFIAVVAAAIVIPETRTREVRQRDALRALRRRRASTEAAAPPTRTGSFWASLPRPLYVFGTLLFLDFVLTFAFAFIEPEMVFYFYEELDWTTVQFGLVVGVYGLAMVIGQATLGGLSDRFGRKPIIVVGALLTAMFYAGLVVVTSFSLVLLVAIVAGLGSALMSPAVSAFYLDITSERYRSRVLGIKGSAASLGGVTGPLLVAGVSAMTTPQGVFSISVVLIVIAAALALTLLTEPRRATEEITPGPSDQSQSETERTDDVGWECSTKRCLAAQAALRGVVLRATRAREARDVA
jgi:multidrug resistance protein